MTKTAMFFLILHLMLILMAIKWLMIYGVTYCKCVHHDYGNSFYGVIDVVVHDADDYDDDNDDTRYTKTYGVVHFCKDDGPVIGDVVNEYHYHERKMMIMRIFVSNSMMY